MAEPIELPLMPAWRRRALCRLADPEDFFPSTGQSAARARTCCAKCKVTRRCLEYAIENYEFGVWGGTTMQERVQIRRERGIPPRPGFVPRKEEAS